MLRNLKDSASKHEIWNIISDYLKNASSSFSRMIPYLSTSSPYLVSTGQDFSVLGCQPLGTGNFSMTYISATSFAVGTGKVLSYSRTRGIVRSTSITKTLDSWASGSAAGSLDTGTIAASTGYSVFAILSTDHTASDILISLSVNSPTLPTGYSYFKHIGSIFTNSSSQIINFVQHGNRFCFLAHQVNRALTVFESTSRISVAVTVPKYMIGIFRVTGSLPGTTAEECFAIVQSSESTNSAATVSNHSLTVYSVGARVNSEMQIPVSSTGYIAIRGSSTSMYIGIATIGYIDTYM